MSPHGDFADFVIEQMEHVGRPRLRAMFGGYSVYQNDCIIAIIDNNKLYFRADSVTRAEFQAKGLSPFTYVARGKFITMQYFEAPPEVFEEADAMRSWVQKAYEAAIRAKSCPSKERQDAQPGAPADAQKAACR